MQSNTANALSQQLNLYCNSDTVRLNSLNNKSIKTKPQVFMGWGEKKYRLSVFFLRFRSFPTVKSILRLKSHGQDAHSLLFPYILQQQTLFRLSFKMIIISALLQHILLKAHRSDQPLYNDSTKEKLFFFLKTFFSFLR